MAFDQSRIILQDVHSNTSTCMYDYVPPIFLYIFYFAFDKTSKHLEQLSDCQIRKNRGPRRVVSNYSDLFIGD
jgi:hypothetical protein